MANAQNSKSGKAASKETTGRKKKAKETDVFVTGDTPIVITGGSLNLEYADKIDDGFDDDGSGGGKKKLKHRKNGTDKVQLSQIDITDKAGHLLFSIKLKDLGKQKDCVIKVIYELE